MLDRLRPLVLEQMGLSEAMRQLLASWQMRYPHINWSLVMPQRFTQPAEVANLTLYRIVQEAVTNVIRHAEASSVEIRVEQEVHAGGGGPQSLNGVSIIALSVSDDGKGLPDSFRYGFGLLGMSERVRQLGGTLSIRNASPKGVIVQALIPQYELAAIEEPTHADPAD
jgi:two-component system, NarL family, sensor histidine kinase UhpB